LRFNSVPSRYLGIVIEKMSTSDPSSRSRGRLRLAGLVVLVLGIAGASGVYWLRTRSPDFSDDLSMVGYNKAQTRQMEQLYGKSGLLIEEWFNDLKQPGAQATIIVVISALIAGGCFYFARLSAEEDESR
jgi:hypothetical protein